MSGFEQGALEELRQVEAELNTRWPETKLEPSLDRIRQLADLLGDPQRSYPVVHVGGTNGKTSTSRMVDALLTRVGLRTGRYTSPHLQLATERISVDGAPISPERYVEVYRDVEPYLAIVDGRNEVPMSKFEVLTGMAFAAFADAPVDAAVVEVGMGGSWDATNIADGKVAVITPIGLDHVEYLGGDIAGIAEEKSGIIKPGSVAVLAQQEAAAEQVLLRRCAEVDASVARLGSEFGVLHRDVAVGGQVLRLQGLGGVYEDVFLPLHGAHQAANAVLALAAVEAFFGAGADRQLDVEAVREAFAGVSSPGRLERVRSAPTVLVDAAHNPHGAQALARALDEEFGFRKLVAVVGVMDDKDAVGILSALEPVVQEVVLTANSSTRAMDPDLLAGVAIPIFGEDRMFVRPHLPDALEEAVRLAEEDDDGDVLSGGGVVVTGSVVTAGEARALFGKEPS
ncbi:bifunctional tetrahydrofolate synthase/dihydrofolate synthase [Saccharothrix syringae]|uniref:Dihydrofolate synthase/folylpolyglutamate synthase n=1 Tax=Saccharothrix syringae TaxID=103733 RepID=A0A5Q0GTC6_SACSY|nr:folylpolyglutamate synthase/dihydrofolate synthase family protein [Saccharothrix syringae]QFZ17219.1 bifunctional folylpolyglutamate synthase/dihydrofolate synthase [Saccharothrix syringae]